MAQALCPNCEKMTSVGNAEKIGEHVKCTHCGMESIIVWLNPIELDVLYDDMYLEDDDDEEFAYEEDDSYYDDEDYEDYP